MVDFNLSEEQVELQKLARDFVQKESRDARRKLVRDFWFD